MNKHERAIFLKGIEIGLNADFGGGDTEIKEKRTYHKKHKGGWKSVWTEEEKQIIRDNPEMMPKALQEFLPGRSTGTISLYKTKILGKKKDRVVGKDQYEGLAKLNQKV